MFKVLGVESRLKIIELLKEKGPLGANEMSKTLGITPSAVSQHLKILKHAGLVRNKRQGYWIPYDIDPKALERCGEFLSTVCHCGCGSPGRLGEKELGRAEDQVARMKKYERELQAELEKVRARLEALEKGE
ncbi:MAG: metalloregulator ArsR/SmtB family transcription factor [Proteobacteria bacterium]|nr:metalloregulator ArsR/SmtB family transcription factor [Pseudomonadota bacterium]MBU1741733.1 metalloregulator ArsR/SmtB family transcription factor [Pseudomonadota bacterium]